MASPAVFDSLSATERRQRRRERILASGEERIKSLITGAPVPLSDAENILNVQPIHSELKAEKILGITELDDVITCIPPNYAEKIEMFHVQIVSIIGIMLSSLHLANYISSIIPIWLTLTLAYHLHRLTKFEMYPKHGYAVNFLLAGGVDERLVRYGGFIVDTVWAAAIDATVMTFSFVTTYILYHVCVALF